MRTLLIRIFLSFWAIIGILVALSALGGYRYAERMHQAFESLEVDDLVLAASEALDAGGRPGLERWLGQRPASDPFIVFVVDESGADLLGRPLPLPVARAFRRFAEHREGYPRGRPERPNLRPARPLTQLVATDGQRYSLFAMPRPDLFGRLYDERSRPWFLLFAIALSALVSYALARAISRPVRRLREATVAIADGNLATRIADAVGSRRDEIGLLARDFDRMAQRLELAAARQVELTRNISHELRSPLARLRVALELARRRAGDLPELRRIEAESEQLDRLIGQILDFSRMQADTKRRPTAFRLAETVREVVDNVNFECRASDAGRVTVEFDAADDPAIEGFPDAIRSAVENVLRNAVRHSPDNGTVRASVCCTADLARIRVEDAGPGVAADELERLFEPFYRTRGSDGSGQPRGTGLGLAIARRAVELHGGTIRARLADGGGLIVEIRLPLSRAGPGGEPEAGAAASGTG